MSRRCRNISNSKISSYITDKLLEGDENDKVHREKLLYCTEYILSELEHIIFFLLIFSIPGYMWEYMMCWLAIGVTRVYIGGIHMKTKEGCFICSFWVYFISIYMSQIFRINMIMKVIIAVAELVIVWTFAPFPSPQRPVYSERRKREFRVKGSAGIVVVTVYAMLKGNSMDCVIWILILQILESVFVISKHKATNIRRKEE